MKIATLVWRGEPIIGALEREWQKRGVEVLRIDIFEGSPHQSVLEKLKSFGAEIIFTHNSYVFDIQVTEGSLLEEGLRRLGIPVVSWYWDSPWAAGSYEMVKRFCDRKFPHLQLAICVDEENRRQFGAAGMASCVLPIGVDLEHFRRDMTPLPEALRVKTISFVGKPNTQVEEATLTRERILFHHCKTSFIDFCAIVGRTPLKNLLTPEVYRKDLLRVRDLLIEFFHVYCWNRVEFERHCDRLLGDGKRDLSVECFRELSIYVGRLEFLYSRWILNDLLFMLREKDIRVFGGDSWGQKYLGDYAYSTPRLSETELRQVFSQSPINLCHTKWQFRTAVHERPFLISACRGFSLTDFRSGLPACFTDSEVPTYENREDLCEKIDFFLANPGARERCAENAYKRVVQDHGYDSRARQLIGVFEGILTGKPLQIFDAVALKPR